MRATLTTARLVLRPATDADVPALRAHWNRPEVRRFLFDDTPVGVAQARGLLPDVWVVHKRTGTTFVGAVGLRQLDDVGHEVLYSLEPTHQGSGYATEAAAAVVDHALDTLELPYVVAEVDEANVASAAVARRLGMTPFATVPGPRGPLIRYRRRAISVGGQL
ncbi:GNAT family N-acetyltransferase [Cryptosporangium aurantiacum]|uniref:Protein N-acetyltransferase, RimJ/RimL family n=1 Tax=Cryptosporangium aurantiacum TaxID=134849 RepID=A0A1M7RC28_9ACTN|nr:GNAT family N-acetyltransferase [Cryptosporangium aurantiacum]SHN43761.1 Protein N-acetyltransferase, RimJ/RimL family [Cryptosporangium aurantiacum]